VLLSLTNTGGKSTLITLVSSLVVPAARAQAGGESLVVPAARAQVGGEEPR
jgi:hypothetical protein